MYKKCKIVLLLILWMFFPKSFICSDECVENLSMLKKYNLSICSLFKNEEKHLKEWIEYHRLIGVDHFYLYDRGSTDYSIRVLYPYIRDGIVSLIRWRDFSVDQDEERGYLWALGTQIPAYEHAIKVKAHETKWLIFLDVSEFLVFSHANKITDLLKQYEESPGVNLSCNFFDASEEYILPKRKLLIESLKLTQAPVRNPRRKVSKTIFKPDCCQGFTWPPYACTFKNEQSAVTAGKNELRINHYLNRDIGYLFRKIKNKLHLDHHQLSDEETTQLLESDYEIEDQERAIFRFVPALLEKIEKDN